jgi:hypothetical protein
MILLCTDLSMQALASAQKEQKKAEKCLAIGRKRVQTEIEAEVSKKATARITKFKDQTAKEDAKQRHACLTDLHMDDFEADIDHAKEEEEPTVNAEIVDEQEETIEIDCIKSHKLTRGNMYLTVKYLHESHYSVSRVQDVWADFPEKLKKYIRTKRLTGVQWRKPTLHTAKKITSILDDRELDDGSRELELLWDNGFRDWATEECALADAKDIVEEYWKTK